MPKDAKPIGDIVKDLIATNAIPLLHEYPDDARIVEFDDIAVDLSVADYIVKGLFDRGDVGVIYGESGSGKTFFTLDMALHVAAGMPWREHRMRQAFVLYVASENPRSVTKRVAAWRDQHAPEGPVAFALMGGAIDLRDERCVERIVHAAKVGAARHKCDATFVVIDTLARASPGADENASGDMSAVIGAADRIRDASGAAVAFVHHSGKDKARGARGHSSLRGAVDFEVEVDNKVATVTKARDTEVGTAYPFRLDRVELGVDVDGDPVTTCIVTPTDAPPPKPQAKRVPGVARTALTALQDVIATKGESLPATSSIPQGVRGVTWATWRDKFAEMSRLVTDGDEPEKAAATLRQRWRRATTALQDAGIVGSTGQNNGYAWIADRSVTP